jgi:hypothetical protein
VDRLRLIHFDPIRVHDVFPSSLGSGGVCLRLDRAIDPQPPNHGQIRQRTFDARVGE